MEALIIGLRFIQYAGAFVLMGGALFLLRSPPGDGVAGAANLDWPRSMLATAAGALLVATVAGLVAQTALLAGSLTAALEPASLQAVFTGMAMGPSSIVRALAAALALVMLGARLGRRRWLPLLTLGVIATGSLAWMGHGAATEGVGSTPHLVADIVHLLAAAAWIGGLVFFVRLTLAARDGEASLEALHDALAGFAGLGSLLVALILMSGLVNSWFLVGLEGTNALMATPYGRLLLLKLALFAVMLVLASANRFYLTPALRAALGDGGKGRAAVTALRISLAVETGAAVAVMAAVAWLGRMSPIAGP